MTILKSENIRELLQKHEPPCVSIYVPMLKGATQANQNCVRFKNLFRRAEDELLAGGMGKLQLDKFFKSARVLLENLQNAINWHRQSNGFAMFLSDGLLKTFRVAHRMPETVHVGERFYTKPLLPLLFEDGRFYILAVSQNGVRFFQGAHDGIAEVELPNPPQGINDILKQYVGERHVESHTGAGKQTGARQAYPVFHGQGGGSLNSDDKIQQYLYEVNKSVWQVLQNEHAPLVFAGVEYLFPMYKRASSYQNLVDEPITGNPDRISAAELHQAALTIIEPRLEAKRQQMINKYRQFAGTVHASSDAKDIVIKAAQGRVDTLFLTKDAQLWGRFDASGLGVELHDTKRLDSEDLLNAAANETFLNNGFVYELAPGNLPDKSPVVAILRF